MPEYHDAVASAPRPAAGPIADVLALYSPRPGENRSYAERRAAALSAVMGQIRNASPGYQDHVMEALNVPALLSQGLIQRPARVLAVQNADGTAAKSHYVQAIRADARLASRLMRRCSEANPAAEGESLDAHFERVAGWDFDRGFDD